MNNSIEILDSATPVFWVDWVRDLPDVETTPAYVMRIVWLTWVSISLFFGVPGNLLVIASIVFMKHMRQLHHVFLANLAVFDLAVMVMFGYMLYGGLYGGEEFKENKEFCNFTAIICSMSCFGSLWSMMFVALNRYIFICQNQFYSRVCGVKGTMLSLVMIWICVFMLDFVNYDFVGVGGHVFKAPLLHCSFTLENTWWFNTMMYTIIALLLPLLIIPYCYYKIWEKASAGNMAKSEKRQREQKQLVISLLLIFIICLITWLPLAIIIFAVGVDNKYAAKVPEELYVSIELWAHVNSSFNFVIYGFTHRGMRTAYKMWLDKIFPCYKMESANQNTAGAANSTAVSTRAQNQTPNHVANTGV
ncbi:melatonin receptor type 1B-like [Convolutriloba macropyga]|uniref:melatonin receptor type 1B-like n=1 Tax=Convolutriloba macropyga TaxID=536237 RepID=UPI003F526BC9